MARGLKIFGGILAVVVIAIVGVFIYVYSNLDSIVKDAVEKYGPQYTGVAVKLDKVELSPENGQGKLSGLLIGNPAGYKTDAAFRLGSIAMVIDIKSLTSNTIVIKSIAIDAPDVTYEFGEGGSNIDVIGKNVETAAGGPGGGSAPQQKPADSANKEAEKKMIVESLVISNGKVSISHPLLAGKKIGSGLPTIRLKDIGKDKKDGASPAEVVATVMDALEKQIGSAVGASGVNNMLKDLGKGAEGAVKGIIEGAGGGAKGVEDAAKGAGDTLKKMFGK